MKNSQIIAAVTASILLVACTEPNGAPGKGIENGGALSKEDVGVAVGVVSGGLIGSAIGSGAGEAAAIIGGGLIGGVLGDFVGKSLDDQDRADYERAAQRAVASGHTQNWSGKDGNHGSVVPHKHYTDSSGRYCREYTQIMTIDGEKHSAKGTACRNDDGTWSVKN